MENPELANAAWWYWLWELIGTVAFLGVVVTLAIEFGAARLAAPYRKILDDAKDLKIAQLTNETMWMRMPRSLDTVKFEASVRKISPPTSVEVLYDANAPDASFLAQLIWGIFFNAKWPMTQSTGPTPLRAPVSNALAWANLPWTQAAGGGPWGLSVVTREQTDIGGDTPAALLVTALLQSVIGPPAQVTLGYQTSDPVAAGAIRVIVGPKTP